MYGYGPVAFATFTGFAVGYIITKEQWIGDIVRLLGFLTLVVGIVTMVTRRSPIIGVPGGLLTGFGLGVDAATIF